jgi:hypothetical protein
MLHYLRKTDDRIERGAKLMTDRTEEFRFRPVGGISLLFRGTQS